MSTAPALHNSPLVSVVIPCYNHGRYLPKAIESVLRQTYSNTEIIVVDDGSTDNTRAVTEKYPAVKYVYQHNQGLSAARNTGAHASTGDCLIFLDADDWLYPKGIEINVSHLLEHREAAFVSGLHDAVYVLENKIYEGGYRVENNHYLRFLQCNYIGMIATVLFQRWVFDEYAYDTALRNCEDYDLFLRVARKYPVYHHQEKIAAYRLYDSNMSGNIPAMLAGVLQVLDRQKNNLRTDEERKAVQTGKAEWKKYYCKELYKKLRRTKAQATKEELNTFRRHSPNYYLKYTLRSNMGMIKSKVRELTPAIGLRLLHKVGLYNYRVPAVGKIMFGDFSRTRPFSTAFGYDRGGPIDRYYIEGFLATEAESIKGRILEIGDNEYTMRFGGKQVQKSDILHVDASNPNATITGDISNAPQIPDNTFDCIILTQTLHLIYDFKAALRTCHRILKPGGTLLLTVPGITPIDHGEWKDTWYWSFTDKAMQKLMQETFSGGGLNVATYGNVFAATAFLHGVGLPEVPKEKLDRHDPHYQVIVAVKAQKV